MPRHKVYTDVNATLIVRCQNGERSAFHEVYQLYAKAMFHAALRILNNKDEAEEVLQDSFLKAFTKIDTYNKNFAFGAWLKRIVINGSLDVLKKRKIVFVPLDDLHHLQNEDQETESDEHAGLYNVDSIKKSIRELPDGYRTILSLYVFEEYTHKEIAMALNISEGTSKSQYNRAKKKLIELLKEKNTDT